MNKSIKILVNDSSDKAFLSANIFFLKEIKKNYNFFENDYKETQKRWKKNSNILEFMNPEKLRYSSPITIFDAKWGMGKTYFFEKLIENCILNNKINLKEYGFERIFLIDLWEYINNEEMINDIVFDVYKKLVPKNISMKNFIKNITNKGLSFAGVFLGNLFTNGNLGLSINLDNEINKDIEKIKKDLKNIEPTIIVFDNLERLENNSIEIIKLIQKISNIKNLLIILPMNKEQFYMNNTSGESKIDKYITLGKYFEFKQDYSNILFNKGVNKNYIKLINILLKEEKNGHILSIRSLEKTIDSITINDNFKKSKYEGMKYLNDCLWECKKSIKNIFREDLNIIFNFVHDIINLFEMWQVKNNSLSLNFNFKYFSNLCNNYGLHESIINKINSIYRFNNSNYQVSINNHLDVCFEQILYSNELMLLIKNIDTFIKKLKEKLDEINVNKIECDKYIEAYKKDIQEIEKKINELNSSISTIEKLGPNVKPNDINKKSRLKIKLQDFEATNKQKNEKIIEINSSIRKNIEEQEEIHKIIENLNHFKNGINEFISLCENIVSDFRTKSDLLFLLKQYESIIKSHIMDNDLNAIVNKIFNYYFGEN